MTSWVSDFEWLQLEVPVRKSVKSLSVNFFSSLTNLRLLVYKDCCILPGIIVIIYRTRTSSLASKLTYFSSIKSNVSNYVQLHVWQKRNCHSPYHIVVDTVYSFRDWVWPWLKQIRRFLFRKKWVSSRLSIEIFNR